MTDNKAMIIRETGSDTINREAERLRVLFPHAYQMLTQFNYQLQHSPNPGVFTLHGKVASSFTVFHNAVEIEMGYGDGRYPLCPKFTITAVIADLENLPSFKYAYGIVFSTQLFLGERNNFYMEHMQPLNDVDPMEVERFFVQAAILAQANR